MDFFRILDILSDFLFLRNLLKKKKEKENQMKEDKRMKGKGKFGKKKSFERDRVEKARMSSFEAEILCFGSVVGRNWFKEVGGGASGLFRARKDHFRSALSIWEWYTKVGSYCSRVFYRSSNKD